MRVKINLRSDTFISLSTSYNRAVQGLIYNSLDPELREQLHDRGYILNNRKFKLFTFSKLFGKYTLKGSYIIFDKYITLLVSSPFNNFIENICNNMLKKECIELEINKLKLESIEFCREPTIENEVKVYTLSPIVVYSTLFTKEGTKKTYYYSPLEREFYESITNNLKKKYVLLYNKEMSSTIEIKPINKYKEVITLFKGTLIRGWHGRFIIKGDRELILTGYRCGLGSKNSAGFGMIEVY